MDKFHYKEVILKHILSRLAKAASIIMTDFIFYQLLTCAITEALCLFSLESNGISVENSVTLYALLSAVITTYVVCHLSETITQNLHNVGDIFYDSNWIALPIKQQMLFMVIIKRSQQIFYLKGFGCIKCSLQVFSSVSKVEIDSINCEWIDSLVDCVISDYPFRRLILCNDPWFEVSHHKRGVGSRPCHNTEIKCWIIDQYWPTLKTFSFHLLWNTYL